LYHINKPNSINLSLPISNKLAKSYAKNSLGLLLPLLKRSLFFQSRSFVVFEAGSILKAAESSSSSKDA